MLSLTPRDCCDRLPFSVFHLLASIGAAGLEPAVSRISAAKPVIGRLLWPLSYAPFSIHGFRSSRSTRAPRRRAEGGKRSARQRTVASARAKTKAPENPVKDFGRKNATISQRTGAGSLTDYRFRQRTQS